MWCARVNWELPARRRRDTLLCGRDGRHAELIIGVYDGYEGDEEEVWGNDGSG